ncbi:YlbE-like family protein [Aeribacillus pallidus]|jgi:hypothetical protein|uniref:YlbE-like family protein n=1 Tax=Aeribacillus pallidus TaxID=33936 RepID=UPI001D933AE3|nr:YlbE-like family protein [Bacillus sp. (in: firmicutes)]
MRSDVMEYIRRDPFLHQFLRQQPAWYRMLSRSPQDLEQFEIASLHYYKKTIPHRVEKFSQTLQMASMMMSMLDIMKQ